MCSLSFWTLDPCDKINHDIWSQSRTVMRRALAAHPNSLATLLQADLDLPWVPDLVGPKWRDAGSVVVIGSAYSPFIDGFAGRGKTMPQADYAPEAPVAAFQERFLRRIVRDDSNYYDPLVRLLSPVIVDSSKAVLLDLCRACLMDRSSGKGGDRAIKADPDLFWTLAVANWRWTRQRLEQSRAKVIIVLGFRAEHVLLRLLHDEHLRISVQGSGLLFEPADRSITGYATGKRLATGSTNGAGGTLRVISEAGKGVGNCSRSTTQLSSTDTISNTRGLASCWRPSWGSRCPRRSQPGSLINQYIMLTGRRGPSFSGRPRCHR